MARAECSVNKNVRGNMNEEYTAKTGLVMPEVQSESIDKLAESLATAQGVFEHARKSVDNPFFKSKYADLASVIDAVRKPLAENGLSVVQITQPMEGKLYLVTTLAHKSGQWIRGWYPISPVKNDPQGMGSALTYARRYAFGAITGIASEEDDDGNAASGKAAAQKKSVFESDALRQMFLDNTSISFDRAETVDALNELAGLAKPKMDEMRAGGNADDLEVANTLSARYRARLLKLKESKPATVEDAKAKIDGVLGNDTIQY